MMFAVATTSGATTGGAGILYGNSTSTTPYTLPSRRTLHLVAAKKFSPRSRRIPPTTTTTTDNEPQSTDEIVTPKVRSKVYDLPPYMGKLPHTEPDFWQGPQWNTLGFIAEYLWVLGGLFALLGGGFAALNYNQGALDFKETPAYKESVESQEEILEQPEVSDSDIFDSNPTEVAPSLD